MLKKSDLLLLSLLVVLITFCSQNVIADQEGNIDEILEPDCEIINKKEISTLIEMVLIKGGTFLMGSDEGRDNERPLHKVTVSDFYIGKHPVLQSEWTLVMGNIYEPNWSEYGQGDNYPAYYISWFDAIEYCNRLSLAENFTPVYRYNGYGVNPSNWPPDWNTEPDNHTNVSLDKNANGYRLPTEAEWEFAARGGNKSKGFKYSGSNDINKVAWYINNAKNSTHPVGSKKANELGLYDMSGNVWEWCWDWYGKYTKTDKTNPKISTNGILNLRIRRGGSWGHSASNCTVTYRNSDRAPHRYLNIGGFRVCRNVH